MMPASAGADEEFVPGLLSLLYCATSLPKARAFS
jgi:hypothetical protein